MIGPVRGRCGEQPDNQNSAAKPSLTPHFCVPCFMDLRSNRVVAMIVATTDFGYLSQISAHLDKAQKRRSQK
jgi:hypothetical protein